MPGYFCMNSLARPSCGAVSELVHAAQEGIRKRVVPRWKWTRARSEKTNAPNISGWLRERRERPAGQHATQKRTELTPSHGFALSRLAKTALCAGTGAK